MRIGELARLANCTTDTIRFYEKEGLLPEANRTDANYRNYNESHIDRLRFIRNCRALDMTHDEVRTLLRAADEHASNCGAVNALVDEHIEHVNARIDELLQLRDQLVVLRQRCTGEQRVDECEIMHGLSSMETPPAGAKSSHLG
ncbi:Cd(II)/Pb(II)-responsive transcriptional regulator [Paraburkholderia dinghuensis]|uniref:Cd(II)/Pb(II)-responsive transcriptional regulator n=1 Tax=Paraburkholderia dinghuensis TaxID=2305225 RepID=A0A3N6PRY1_9BURK|nr:Cd(II)/Pb(II)-responsive transcriptional regulator [Paraburkholderia dinghuensis]RQH02206.1 Cd(II)/Pb(II)-responsive transcriptional regulator [Paraburkholderia dinghuensis]